MISASDLRRMAMKLRALGSGQGDIVRNSLDAMADRYEADAYALDVAMAEAAKQAGLLH